MNTHDRLIGLDTLNSGTPTQSSFAFSEEERAELTGRLDILSISELSAELKVSWRSKDQRLAVSGTVTASVEQACVVTLQPVQQSISEPISIEFLAQTPDIDLDDIDELDGPDLELLESDTLDLEEIAVQTLSLALDPYPRAPDATLPKSATAPDPIEQEPPRSNPFAKLAALKEEG